MWNLKYNTNEHIYKTETDSQVQKTNVGLPNRKRKKGGANKGYGINRYTLYETDNATDRELDPSYNYL